MTPSRWTWWWYAACGLAVLGGLGWASFQAVEFERREAQAKADAAVQEAVRLSLWRMESTLAPLIARESSRPYFEYRSFYPADRAFTNMLNDFRPGEVVVPSPLLRAPEAPILLHFEIDKERGALTSPQVPGDTPAADAFATGYELAAARVRLDALRELLLPPPVAGSPLAQQVPPLPEPGSSNDRIASESESGQSTASSPVTPPPKEMSRDQTGAPDAQAALAPPSSKYEKPAAPAPAPAQLSQNVQEYQQRSRANEGINRSTLLEKQAVVVQADSKDSPGQFRSSLPKDQLPTRDKSDPKLLKDLVEKLRFGGTQDRFEEGDFTVRAFSPETAVVQSELVPRWIGEGDNATLLLTREVRIGDRKWTQGFWLDWGVLRTQLLDAAGGLLPGATLAPAGDAALADPASLGRRLAAIPAELVLPPAAPVRMARWSPLRTTLVMTWVGALGGVLAIGLVLHAATELAERRGRFVSAVTHELRTPLTTFCLYSQMLSDGIVKDPEQQQSYFATLRTESQRLARIVESVLDYARLGRRKPGNGKVVMRVGELIDQCIGALAARCEQAGMQLVVQRDGDADQPITTDPATVERVLFNLVDNACKYASGVDDKRVHLDVRVSTREVELLVRDHGPGIERAERGRIFRPFVRGKKQADGSVSGLGLGLALAKGLAAQLGGGLELAAADSGAAFSLSLPLGA